MMGKFMAAAVAIIVVPLLIFQLTPSVLVRDTTGQVASVTVVNEHYLQRLPRLPGGLFLGFPKIEGAIEIQCRNGLRNRESYSSGQIHHFETVDSASICALASAVDAPVLNP